MDYLSQLTRHDLLLTNAQVRLLSAFFGHDYTPSMQTIKLTALYALEMWMG
tara:strand:+ start:1105 stop:1257 length:153 start_codon:yes stop_codon:yes gene_type:complete